MATATSSPPRHRKTTEAFQLTQAAFHRLELLHHLFELRELLEQPVDVLHGRAAAARDALAARAIDDLGIAPLLGRHRPDDRVEAAQIRLLAGELLRRALEHFAERQHTQHLIERAERLHLLELRAEVFEGESVL